MKEASPKRTNTIEFHLHKAPRVVSSRDRTAKSGGGGGGEGAGMGSSRVLGTRFQFGVMKRFWRGMVVVEQ